MEVCITPYFQPAHPAAKILNIESGGDLVTELCSNAAVVVESISSSVWLNCQESQSGSSTVSCSHFERLDAPCCTMTMDMKMSPVALRDISYF